MKYYFIVILFRHNITDNTDNKFNIENTSSLSIYIIKLKYKQI